MTSRIEKLLQAALLSVPGMELNQALWDLREARLQQHSNVVCYEIVLEPKQRWSDFLNHLPKLSEHLKAKGLSQLPQGELLIIVWNNVTAHILDGDAFFGVIQRIENLDEAQLRARMQGRAALIALPPPKLN